MIACVLIFSFLASAACEPQALIARVNADMALKCSFNSEVKSSLVVKRTFRRQNRAVIDPSQDGVRRRLRKAMDAAGVSNTVLADAVGVSVQAVGDWLRRGTIARKRIAAICAVLLCSPDWLLTGAEAAQSYKETRTLTELISWCRANLAPEDQNRLALALLRSGADHRIGSRFVDSQGGHNKHFRERMPEHGSGSYPSAPRRRETGSKGITGYAHKSKKR